MGLSSGALAYLLEAPAPSEGSHQDRALHLLAKDDLALGFAGHCLQLLRGAPDLMQDHQVVSKPSPLAHCERAMFSYFL